jgi:hypothetical protein
MPKEKPAPMPANKGAPAAESRPGGGTKAVGPLAGEFSLKATSVSLVPATAGSTSQAINFEGPVPGFGDVLGTLTMSSAGQKAGTWIWCAVAYAPDGSGVIGNGQGSFTGSGADGWQIGGFIHISDGRDVSVESEFKLSTRRWTGKLYAVV